ncbi:MAG: hypothetical protein JEZ11_03770 [Desulfobacterales bacterium]|nr:hypothetical protein [Desulfobacterales bacterium]
MNTRLNELLEKLDVVAGDPDGPLHDPEMAELARLIRAQIIPLPQAQYVNSRGTICPNCGGSDCVTTDELSLEDGSSNVFGNSSCCDCEATWTELYQLMGFENLKR